MLDIKRIREDFEGVKKAVESRQKGDFGIDNVRDLDQKRRDLLKVVEAKKNQQSVTSKQIPKLKKEGKDASGIMAEMKALSGEIKEMDAQVAKIEEELRDAILNVPNTPAPDVPV